MEDVISIPPAFWPRLMQGCISVALNLPGTIGRVRQDKNNLRSSDAAPVIVCESMLRFVSLNAQT